MKNKQMIIMQPNLSGVVMMQQFFTFLPVLSFQPTIIYPNTFHNVELSQFGYQLIPCYINSIVKDNNHQLNQNMLFRNSNTLNISSRPLLARKNSIQLTDHDDKPDSPATTQVSLAHLTKLGVWIFDSSCFINISTTTLYLAVSIIDRLRQLGFIVQTGKVDLLGAVALLLSSKFNEVEQLRVQKINARLDKGVTFSLEQYRDIEGEVLETLGFSLTGYRSIYLRFCELYYRFFRTCPTRVQNFCKMCLKTPKLQRYGSDNLIEAIVFLCERKRGKLRQANKCVRQLIRELLQLQKNDQL